MGQRDGQAVPRRAVRRRQEQRRRAGGGPQRDRVLHPAQERQHPILTMTAPYLVPAMTPLAGPTQLLGPARPADPRRRFGVASPMMSERMPSTVSVSAG